MTHPSGHVHSHRPPTLNPHSKLHSHVGIHHKAGSIDSGRGEASDKHTHLAQNAPRTHDRPTSIRPTKCHHSARPMTHTRHAPRQVHHKAGCIAGRGQASDPRMQASRRSCTHTRQHSIPLRPHSRHNPTPMTLAHSLNPTHPRKFQGGQANFTLKLALEDDSNLPRGGGTRFCTNGAEA